MVSSVKDLTYIDGTVYKTKDPDSVYDGIMLPSFEEICASKETYARSFYTQYCNTDPFTGKTSDRTISEQMLCGAESTLQAADYQ